jgi:hypothetical protein
MTCHLLLFFLSGLLYRPTSVLSFLHMVHCDTFFLDLVFDTEDGHSTFLWNSSELLTTQCHITKDSTLHRHHCRNLKPDLVKCRF